ncbi:MAG: hypothetical protein SPG91_01915 [Oscillospiraceae bacterium]|nr:hypothetical protein [Oscillospiraceae bacterium]
MKRILALIMVLAMVFAFAACKGKDDGATTTDPSSAGGEVIDNGDGSTVPADASAADSTDVSGDASEVSTDASGKPVEAPSQAAGSQGSSQGGSTPAAAKTVAEIVADYVKARKATKPAPAGKQTMVLGNNGKITGDGATGSLFKVASPIINKVLQNNSTTTDYVPASSHSDLKASDVKSAKAIVSADGKYTDYIIYVKDQTDGPNGDSHNGGPVARGVGTLGSIDEALKQLGAEFKSGKENVKLTYTNAYIFARVDNSTGKIINGTYHYLVKINISEAELKLGISAKVKNMYGEVDYTVKIGNNKQGYNGAKG